MNELNYVRLTHVYATKYENHLMLNFRGCQATQVCRVFVSRIPLVGIEITYSTSKKRTKNNLP